jgi:hypothetical protein
MATDRGDMTVRVVPLRSAEAGDSRVGGTVAERVALVVTLSEELWARTQKPLPTYTRETMPVALKPLRAQSGGE